MDGRVLLRCSEVVEGYPALNGCNWAKDLELEGISSPTADCPTNTNPRPKEHSSISHSIFTSYISILREKRISIIREMKFHLNGSIANANPVQIL
ncbi:hypothetical protein niasHT_022555 [Heterodera trifolii]|uniref:Uncharacterized protein n=1 Tax=Heterodera trifolii TaxID=157864 RepID=A0ABD2JR44_9BILA